MNTYTYDSANRLKMFNGQGNNATYSYNGLGDRLQETASGITTTFTMDLNTGLTQALSDGTNIYIYGNGRIAQTHDTATEYFLGDALGSVRQLTNTSGVITYARAYDPYGVVAQTSSASQSTYGYTGEYTSNDMVYLRARYYIPGMGRFLTRDTWGGDDNRPMSMNRWGYVEGNPINLLDPSGLCGLSTGSFDGKYDCTLKDMERATIKKRTTWFDGLTADMDIQIRPRSSSWFNNVKGILNAFNEQNQNTSEWVRYVDAGILLTIQDDIQQA